MRHAFMLALCISLCVLVLTGCDNGGEYIADSLTSNTNEWLNPDETITPVVEPTTPAVAGSLQTEKLESTSWDSGRTNETSNGEMWETENGYYLTYQRGLFYADKTDLSNWVPVCYRPDCAHKLHVNGGYGTDACEAYVGDGCLLKDGRIYFGVFAGEIPAFLGNEQRSQFIASMALDGSDKKIEYVFEEVEALTASSSGAARMILSAEYCMYNYSVLNQEGTYDAYIYVVDEDGLYIPFSAAREETEQSCFLANTMYGIFGDQVFCSTIIDNSYTTVYRIDDRELTAIDIDGLPLLGSHLSGDIFRVFRANDGYYDINWRTREETKLENAQLKNSSAYILAPNCILESSLLGTASLALRTDVDTHAMKMFDGENWMDVTLPEDVLYEKDTAVLLPWAVTSDRIIIMRWDTSVPETETCRTLYQILLDTDTPTLEYLGTIG